MRDAFACEVPLFMSNVVIISQQIAAGTLRPLSVTTRGETRHVQGARSFAQQGFGDFEAPTWWAFLGRDGTPQPILDRTHTALTSVLNEPEVKNRIEALGCDIVAGSPDERRTFLASEIETGALSSASTTSPPTAEAGRGGRHDSGFRPRRTLSIHVSCVRHMTASAG